MLYNTLQDLPNRFPCLTSPTRDHVPPIIFPLQRKARGAISEARRIYGTMTLSLRSYLYLRQIRWSLQWKPRRAMSEVHWIYGGCLILVWSSKSCGRITYHEHACHPLPRDQQQTIKTNCTFKNTTKSVATANITNNECTFQGAPTYPYSSSLTSVHQSHSGPVYTKKHKRFWILNIVWLQYENTCFKTTSGTELCIPPRTNRRRYSLPITAYSTNHKK